MTVLVECKHQEKYTLIQMDDGFRVRSDITREGVIVYEFPEVQHRQRLGAGRPDEGDDAPASA